MSEEEEWGETVEEKDGWLGEASEGMETITTILRQAREQKGVSLKDVEGQTRIPLKYLQALEGGGENGLLADEMYLIPFLRSYANFLGVDANQAVTRFLTELQSQDAATVAPPEHRPPVVRPRSGPSRLASWVVPFLFLLGALLVGSYLWQQGYLQTLALWWQAGKAKEELISRPSVATPSSPPAVAVVPQSPVAVVPPPSAMPDAPASGASSSAAVAVVPQPESSTAGTSLSRMPTSQGSPTGDSSAPTVTGAIVPQSETPAVAVVSPPAVGASTSRHRLSIRANSPTWMRVVVDNQPGKDLTLKPGEAREWDAQNSFMISLGNAGGVSLNLDGQDLPPPGKSGQVVKNMRLPAPTTGQ